MLVTFKTKAYANITMFGDVAIKLLRMMGHSGTVPGAIKTDDVPAALERLKAAIAEQRRNEAPEDAADADDGEQRVNLSTRALPLIELLEAAAKRGSDVMWEE